MLVLIIVLGISSVAVANSRVVQFDDFSVPEFRALFVEPIDHEQTWKSWDFRQTRGQTAFIVEDGDNWVLHRVPTGHVRLAVNCGFLWTVTRY